MNERTARLGTDPTHKVLARLALPATASLLINATYNIVDSIFVGRFVGTDGLAAVGLNFPLNIFLIAIGILVGVGGSALISRRLGAGEVEDAQRAFGSCLTLLIGSGVLFAGLGVLFAEPATVALGGRGEMLEVARAYFIIIATGSPFLIANQALNNVVYAEGAGGVGFFALTLSSVLNIVLDWIFIGRLGMGVAGAAYATVASQAVATLFLIGYFTTRSSQLALQPCLCWDDMKETLRIGVSAALRTLSVVVMGLVVNRSALRVMGDLGVAVASVVFRVVSIVVLPAFGINQAFLPVAAYNYGAGKPDRVIRSSWQAILMSLVICFAASISVSIFSVQIAAGFNPDPQFISIAARGFRRMFLLTPFLIFNLVGAAIYQAVGDGRRSLLISISRMAFFMVPLLLVLPRFYGLDGIWHSFPIGESMSTTFAILVTLPQIRRLRTLSPDLQPSL